MAVLGLATVTAAASAQEEETELTLVPTSDFAGATISVSGGDPCLFQDDGSEDPPEDLGDTLDRTLETVDELLQLNEPVAGTVLLSVESTADGSIVGTSEAPADPVTGEWTGEVTVSEDAEPGFYLVSADCVSEDPNIPAFGVGQATFEVLAEEPPDDPCPAPGPGCPPPPPSTTPIQPGQPTQPGVDEGGEEEEEPAPEPEPAPEEPPAEPTPPATPVNGEPDDMTG